MTKVSVSLPEELINSVQNRYPNVPFSKALALIIQEQISGSNNPTSNTSNTSNTNPTHEDLQEIVKNILHEEISKLNPISDEWLSNGQVAQMLPDSIPIKTRIRKVSNAVSEGILKTNGKKRTECRIQKTSVLSWIASF